LEDLSQGRRAVTCSPGNLAFKHSAQKQIKRHACLRQARQFHPGQVQWWLTDLQREDVLVGDAHKQRQPFDCFV